MICPGGPSASQVEHTSLPLPMKLSLPESIFPSSYLPPSAYVYSQVQVTGKNKLILRGSRRLTKMIFSAVSGRHYFQEWLFIHPPACPSIISSAWCLENLPHHPLDRLGFPSSHCPNTLSSYIELICLSVSSTCTRSSFRARSRPCSSLNSFHWHSAQSTSMAQ